MTDPSTSDHDLLIRIETKLDLFMAQVNTNQDKTDKAIEALWSAVTGLKEEFSKIRNQAQGLALGGKVAWALVGVVPAGAIAAILDLTR